MKYDYLGKKILSQFKKLNYIEKFDINEKLLAVTEKSRKSMNKRLVINNEEDMYYAQRILKIYFIELKV